MVGRSWSRIGDPVGSTGSQRLFRSGVPTIGGELGSSGVSRVAPFVKEAPPRCPRSGQMSNPVGNRLPFYIYATRLHRYSLTHAYSASSSCVLTYLSTFLFSFRNHLSHHVLQQSRFPRAKIFRIDVEGRDPLLRRGKTTGDKNEGKRNSGKIEVVDEI